MKKIILPFLAALTFLLWNEATAQDNQATTPQEQPTTINTNFTLDPAKMKDGYAKYQNSMIQLKGGKMMPLTKDVTMSNGVRVYKNGYVTLPGKKKQMLQDNYAVNTNGKIVMLQYDMIRHDVIEDHSLKTLGNTETEVVVIDNGIALAGKPGANAEMLNRRNALISERNALIQQKANLLNQARDNKAQQRSEEIKAVDAQIKQITADLKQLEQSMKQR